MAVMKAAALQMGIVSDKEKNIENAGRYIARAAGEGADMAVLPEMFNCPYNTTLFPSYAEAQGGESWARMSEMARRHRLYLVAGSMPELGADGRVYNTAYVFDRQGNEIAKHRKAHLFDIAIKNGQYFKESDTLSPGEKATVFETEFGTLGLCICYDIRFPELFRMMADKGAQAVVVPAAFNMTTGPAHWEILFRVRALDNQAFLIGAAPARSMELGYVSWGHSIMADPWGGVMGQLDAKEDVLIRDLDLGQVERVRSQLPLLAHRRKDLYAR